MGRRSRNIFLSMALVFTAGQALASDIVRFVTVKLSSDRHELKDLKARGYRVTGVSYERNEVVVMLKDNEEIVLGGDFDVMQTEMIRTSLAPEEGYHTHEEVKAQLAAWQNEYPRLMTTEVIGKSLEGRDILAVKITGEAPSSALGKPAILFNAMHHAREVMTVEVALDIIEQLVTKYDEDPTVKKWVDDNEIWVVPMLNPDGNDKVWTNDSMWRKNTRDNIGVDLNRNYPFAWASCNGSSSNRYADDYHGPSAASEPETQTMMRLVERIKPVFDISYHSYSELEIYPYGCDGERADNDEVVSGIGKELAGKLRRDSNNGTYDPGTSWELLYAVDGGDIDWMHHEHGVLPYVVEVNSTSQGFQPPYSWRQPTVEKMRPGWQLLLDKLGQSGVRGVVRHAKAVRKGRVRAKNLSGDGRLYETAIHRDGTYHMILPAGMYRLEIGYDGKTESREVIIGGSRVDLS